MTVPIRRKNITQNRLFSKNELIKTNTLFIIIVECIVKVGNLKIRSEINIERLMLP